MEHPKPNIHAIFGEAIELDSEAKRLDYLDQACGGDTRVRERVEALLRADADAGNFFGGPVSAVGATIDQPVADRVGAQIGSYKIREQIGEGAFGAVYVAQQQKPLSRKVALKIIKLGMDSKNIIARFESERQALAMMDHPNVAKVLDAGATESGRPYFVMELVHGLPITDFSDDQKLSARQRLHLFADVCRAVQHAHQKGIIHRDLKPSNIMVTMHDDKPVPKVIDFGISKALSQKLIDDTVYTAYGQMVGTPLYMSPEQAQMSGLDVDTRSDVYSLGVLLYELLTGTTPFEKETLKHAEFDEMRRMIREDAPPRPSARLSTLDAELLSTVSARRKADPRKLRQLCRGELDWIVMKALEKDRTRRYETANDFAADIHRFLDDQPVEACPPTAAYRFRKFARRNKAPLATLSLVAAALIFGMLGTTWQAVRADGQRDRALTAERQSREDQREAETARTIAVQAKEREVDLRRQAESLLTSSHVDRAQALCEQGEIGRGMLWLAHSLRTAPEDAKDLERVIRTNLAVWRPQLHSLKTLIQHKDRVRGVALSPDGMRILSGSGDGEIRLSDVATGQPIGKAGQHAHLNAVAFSPDGSRFVTASYEDGTLRLWDAATVQPIGEPLQNRGSDRRVVFNADGSQFATDKGGTVSLWDAATGEPVREPFEHEDVDDQSPHHNVRTVAFTAKGLRAVITTDLGTHQLWDIDRAEPVGPPVVNTPDTLAAAISPDGLRFATAGFEGLIRVWDAATAELALAPIMHGGVIWSLAFSGDGTRIVSGGNERSARLWDANNGQAIGVPMRHRGTVNVVAFSRDDTHILTGSADGTARLWEVASDNSLGQLVEHKDGVLGAAFGPDALRIMTGDDGAFQLRNHTTGQPVGKPFSTASRMMAFSPDGTRVVIGGQLWDVAAGELIGKLAGKGLFPHDVAFSPDGSRIVMGYQERARGGFAQLWDTDTAEPIGKRLEHNDVVFRVAFSPDGSRLITGSLDATTRLWDAETLEPIGQPLIHQSELKSLAYSQDGTRILTGYADWTVRLWDAATLTPIGVPLHHQNIVSGAAFSRDGSRLLTCSLDQTARIWDATTLKPIGPPLQHRCHWPRVSFRPDGAEFLVTGLEGEAQIWKSPPGPLEGDHERIVLWTQVITGLELDASGGIGVLNGPTWQVHFRRLQELGGPPRSRS